ncbi:MAG TPA: FecR domain-containing protein [Rhizomicrobium sp.]|nr:FecR domain-containing protein [Rhizomicrobium sp.]
MTSPDVARSASDVREQAAEWLFRAASGDWTADDQAQLDAWLLASEHHRASYWRLEAAWQEGARLAALRPASRGTAVLKRLFNVNALKAAAAVVLIGVGATAAYHKITTPNVSTYATAVGGHRTLTLPDGTVIELNTDTVVSIANDLAQRRVWLTKGEALFEVKHDARHPFTVIAGNHTVTDLGTKFVVRQTSTSVEVALIEGRAQFESIGGSAPRSTELAPGEVAVATGNSMSVTRLPVKQVTDELAWRQGLLVFDGTTLADAVAELNRYNTDKIVIRDPSLAQLRVNGTFPVHARHDFAEVARAVFGLRAQDKGSEILISR